MRALLAVVTATSLGLPAHAWAAPPAEEPEAAPEKPAEIKRAQKLYDDGLGKYQTADYAGAIELWTQAFTIVPNEPENARIKAEIIYNLAQARQHQFHVDKDIAELRQAAILLESYLESIPKLYDDGLAAEKEKLRADKLLLEIKMQINDAEAQAGPVVTEPGPAGPAGPTEPDAPPKRPGRGLVTGGGVLLGLGGVALGVAGAGMAIGAGANDIGDLEPTDAEGRGDQFKRGRTGNAMAIAGGVGAAILIGAGIGLIVAGKAKQKKSDASVAVTPSATGEYAGVSLSGRF